MPYACNLYPLGDLWTNRSKSPSISPTEQGDRKEAIKNFLSLDIRHCEGLHLKDATKQNVKSYMSNRGLDRGREEWDWFLELSSRVAGMGLVEKLLRSDPSGTCADAFFTILSKMWYDFDSIIDTQGKKAASQPNTQRMTADNSEQLQESPPTTTMTKPGQHISRDESLAHEWQEIQAAIGEATIELCNDIKESCDFSLRGKKFERHFIGAFLLGTMQDKRGLKIQAGLDNARTKLEVGELDIQGLFKMH